MDCQCPEDRPSRQHASAFTGPPLLVARFALTPSDRLGLPLTAPAMPPRDSKLPFTQWPFFCRDHDKKRPLEVDAPKAAGARAAGFGRSEAAGVRWRKVRVALAKRGRRMVERSGRGSGARQRGQGARQRGQGATCNAMRVKGNLGEEAESVHVLQYGGSRVWRRCQRFFDREAWRENCVFNIRARFTTFPKAGIRRRLWKTRRLFSGSSITSPSIRFAPALSDRYRRGRAVHGLEDRSCR